MSHPSKENNLHGLAGRLVSNGLLNLKTAQSLYQTSQQDNTPFISQLMLKNILASKEIAKAASQDFGLPLFDLSAIEKEFIPIQIINVELMQRNRAFPLFIRGKSLFVAISDPTNANALDEFKFHSGFNTHAIIVEDHKLVQFIARLCHRDDLGDFSEEALAGLRVSHYEEENDGTVQDPNDDLVIKYVNKIILEAINRKASDIHFEPYVNSFRIRFRIDGILYEIAHPPCNVANRIAARLKVMSRLDISERRVPQDGHFKMARSKQRSIEFRVNTCPTIAGEKIVLRLIDPASTTINVEQLGYESKQKDAFLEAIHRPQGMVVVTGPTGSGKTVSLYTALNILNTSERNISTVEDPVELHVKGINQVSVNIKAGLTFASAMRAFLRQDPDVIMVGEIRDLETAEIAIKAAQTGHLVLSTLHTNSAAETLMRLANMGVPSYNIATSINLIVAQRLARRLCKHCKIAIDYPPETLLEIGFTEEQIKGTVLYEAVGCAHCTNGFSGRLGIYEVMQVSEAIGRLIMSGGNAIEILDLAKKEGFTTLRESGLQKILAGHTNLTEINRVTKD